MRSDPRSEASPVCSRIVTRTFLMRNRSESKRLVFATLTALYVAAAAPLLPRRAAAELGVRIAGPVQYQRAW